MLLVPLWFLDLSGFIKAHIWGDPEALQFMFVVYHIELATDLLITFRAKQLTGRLAFRKVCKVLFSCIGAAALLYVATGAAKYSPGFSWFPTTVFFIILAGLILIILRRGSKLGLLNPVVADVLEVRIKSLINLQKNEQHNDLEGNQSGEPVPMDGLSETVKN